MDMEEERKKMGEPMEQRIVLWLRKQGKLAGFCIFLLFMWICTLVSKSIYASKLPRVLAQEPEKRRIEHAVEADGSIKQGSSRAVHTLAGLRVEKINVRAGDAIEKGDILFELDKEDLEEIIEQKKLEAAKLSYQVKDLEQNRMLAGNEKKKEIGRAEEDYETAKREAGIGSERADTALNQADERLKEHLAEGVNVTSQAEREKADREYGDWLKRGEQMQATVSGNQVNVAEKEKQLEDMKESGSQEEVKKALEELENARNNLKSAQDAYEDYKKNPMQKPDFSAEDTAKKAWETQKQSLEENLRNAGYGKEDADMAGEKNIRNAERNSEDAQTPEQADSTLEIYRMELKSLEEEIEKYSKIYQEEGKVTSEAAGTVTRINLTVGERTTDGAAIICADDEVPYQFEALLSKEQKKYVDQGDEVILKTTQGKEELTIDYMEEEENGGGVYRAVIYLPEGKGELGMSGVLMGNKTSENYGCCVPIDALHSENNGSRYYVYLAKEREGILGKERYAQLRYVKVLDQNDSYAALEEGSIGEDEIVIVRSDKEIENGEVVRFEE